MKTKITVLAVAALLIAGGVWVYRRMLPPRQPNVVILLLDTLRADHLGFYGYGRKTSPVLDRFFAENLSAQNAVTAAPWTPPSVTSILSGLYVASHGLMPPNGRPAARKAASKLNPAVPLLSEIFKAHGYATGAVSSNPWISEEFGFNRGFDHYSYLPKERAEAVVRGTMKMVDDMRALHAPLFLYIHFLDPHDPYDPPPGYAEKFQGAIPGRTDYDDDTLEKISRYDGEINYMDEFLGKLFEFFKKRGLYDDMVIVVVGDHGEQFNEHGHIGHGYQLYHEELSVPLAVKTGRGSAPRSIKSTVSTIDIFPTLLQLAGIEYGEKRQGVSLLADEHKNTRPGVLSEIRRKMKQRAFTSWDGKKLIIGAKMQGERVQYDDPAKNIVGIFDRNTDFLDKAPSTDMSSLPELQAEFSEAYRHALALKVTPRESTDGSGQVSEDTLNQLESLGYLK